MNGCVVVCRSRFVRIADWATPIPANWFFSSRLRSGRPGCDSSLTSFWTPRPRPESRLARSPSRWFRQPPPNRWRWCVNRCHWLPAMPCGKPPSPWPIPHCGHSCCGWHPGLSAPFRINQEPDTRRSVDSAPRREGRGNVWYRKIRPRGNVNQISDLRHIGGRGPGRVGVFRPLARGVRRKSAPAPDRRK